ncbi:ATP-binding cassette domain-containing protein [Mycobacterium sp. ML5]
MSDAAVSRSNRYFFWPDGTRVFEGLSFDFDAGRTGLVAPNGAGKTTLLNPVAGRYRPDRGDVSVQGALTDRIDRTQRRREVHFAARDERSDPGRGHPQRARPDRIPVATARHP